MTYKEEKELEKRICSEASDWACENEIVNANLLISISIEDGWTKVKLEGNSL